MKPSEAARDLSVIPAPKNKKRAVVFQSSAAKNKVRKTAHGCDAGRYFFFALFCIAHIHIVFTPGGL